MLFLYFLLVSGGYPDKYFIAGNHLNKLNKKGKNDKEDSFGDNSGIIFLNSPCECCGYSLEVLQCCTSNLYSQHMLLCRNKNLYQYSLACLYKSTGRTVATGICASVGSG